MINFLQYDLNGLITLLIFILVNSIKYIGGIRYIHRVYPNDGVKLREMILYIKLKGKCPNVKMATD